MTRKWGLSAWQRGIEYYLLVFRMTSAGVRSALYLYGLFTVFLVEFRYKRCLQGCNTGTRTTLQEVIYGFFLLRERKTQTMNKTVGNL